MSDPIQTVAMRICDLRDIAGLSQEQVAERAGVPLEEYIAYEAGTCDFSFSHLFNIAGFSAWIFPICSPAKAPS